MHEDDVVASHLTEDEPIKPEYAHDLPASLFFA